MSLQIDDRPDSPIVDPAPSAANTTRVVYLANCPDPHTADEFKHRRVVPLPPRLPTSKHVRRELTVPRRLPGPGSTQPQLTSEPNTV